MVASNIRCIVVEVPVHKDDVMIADRPRARDLLPWADPYIAKLIRNLQDEVRSERATDRKERMERAAAQATFLAEAESFPAEAEAPLVKAEAQPPLVETPVEADPTHEYLWPRANEWDD